MMPYCKDHHYVWGEPGTLRDEPCPWCRIAELEAERDDYKSRWEQTGCTRHEAIAARMLIQLQDDE